mmetsp:Transcript_13058/g.14945  ORF Transcript_13058/g.14945 Transcript_13058/m.14945 type:complete len:215 (+) Transcript_13058:150-794(+)
MPLAELNNILGTVAFVQLVSDLLANHFVFKTESYQRQLGSLSRAQFKLKKMQDQEKEGKIFGEKQLKKLQRAVDDLAEISANVAKRHSTPNIFTSITFLILYRILATEYSDKVIAILPFVPYSIVQRLSLRGLNFDEMAFNEKSGITINPNQACSFVFVYILCTLTVKFFVHKAVGVSPPKGADGGILSMMDAPQNQKVLKQFGLDNETLNKQA